jgi:hypothetical protein
MFDKLFQKAKPKEKTKVSQKEKKEIYEEAMKKKEAKKRQAQAAEIQKDTKKDMPKEEKVHYSEIEVYEFELDELKTYDHRIEHYKGHDEQIIMDEQFLLNEDDDPDKVYQELKKKQQRRIQMDNEEKKLSENIKKGNKEESEENEAFKKIRDYLKKSPAADRLDFTQNLLKMAQELGKQLTINGILPSFKILASDNENIKIALAEQVNPIASFLIDSPDSDEYQTCLSLMVPILNEFLYDKSDKVKKKAVKALVEFCDLLTPTDRGDYILKFMLELAHEEDNEKARVTALQILNKVAGKLDSEL